MALWRVEQAAEYLGIRPKTLYEWVRLGRVPHRKIGFNVRFDPDELEQWTEGQAQGAETESDDEASTGEEQALSALAADASVVLRQLERDVGASLSFPQRRKVLELAERLERATAGRDG